MTDDWGSKLFQTKQPTVKQFLGSQSNNYPDHPASIQVMSHELILQLMWILAVTEWLQRNNTVFPRLHLLDSYAFFVAPLSPHGAATSGYLLYYEGILFDNHIC